MSSQDRALETIATLGRNGAPAEPAFSVEAGRRRAELDAQLKALQKDAIEHYAIDRRTNEQLWIDLAKTYLWWREASRETGYLNALYKQRGIHFRSGENRPNFNPPIRVVWNFQHPEPPERVRISKWNQALQAMHEQYSQNRKDFDHNPEGKLVALIKSHGGVWGLAETVSPLAPEETDADGAAPPKQSRPKKVSENRVAAELVRHALTQVKTSKGIGTLTLAQPSRVGCDSLLVLLARREENGRLTILGSSNDPIQIEAVAASVARHDITNLPLSLRALVEIITTQAFPSHALPSSPEQRSEWYLTKYADKSDLFESDLEGWERAERGRRLTSSKRLLLRGNNCECIFSGSRVTVAPVTRCQLNEAMIEEGDAVFMRASDRAKVEQWYTSNELALSGARPAQRLKRAADTDRATYKLDVANTVTQRTTTLHFYNHSADNITHYQAEFRRDAFEPAWRTKVNGQWFQNLRQGWTDKWFADLGRYNQITRKNNAVLEIKVTPDNLDVIFNRHPDASPSASFAWPKAIANFTGHVTAKFLSKDLGPILFNLADALVSGAVVIAGNKHALLFTYESSVGQFEIAVPTLDETGKHRDGTLFYAKDKVR